MENEKAPAYNEEQVQGLPAQHAQAPAHQQPFAEPHQHQQQQGQDSHAEHDFGTGLFDCSASGCLMSWCSCIVHSEIKQRRDHLQNAGTAIDDSKVEVFDNTSILYLLLNCVTGCSCVLDVLLRGDLRKQYHIKGDGGKDFFAVCCCMPCAQQQMLREVKLEEAKAPVVQQQMGATAPMKIA